MTESELEQMRAAIGPRADYYLAQFDKVERGGTTWGATWNWPAFFLSSGWFAYRRMGGYSLLNFFLPIPFILLIPAIYHLSLLLIAVYLALVFVYIPLYANLFYYRHLKRQITRAAAPAEDAKKAKKPPLPPSFVTGIEAVLTAALAFFIPAVILIAPAAYGDYAPRAKVAESISHAVTLREPIAVFYHEHKRFPNSQEAAKFRIDGSKYAQSIVYDAEKRMITVTMGHEEQPDYLRGKRFAMHAEERDGTIFWNCRTVDLDRKVPAIDMS